MTSTKIPKKEGRRILNFSQELQKDKSFQMLSPAIYLEGWLDILNVNIYMIKPSKKLI